MSEFLESGYPRRKLDVADKIEKDFSHGWNTD
jgi:hypothetical protein